MDYGKDALAQYRAPQEIRVGRGPDSEKLYELEHKRNELIQRCAKEWANVTGTTGSDFWKVILPQQLFDILDSFDVHAAYRAAKAYVERYERNHK